ncbi:hypothetical protein AB0I28_31970 [Phytomonospora sp. NPDC050363]|uniref:hypothetical protein n=1 Tax=Phytomonospora sp. NPDC050363 TaxID=3155642 RepID=UPI0033DCD2DA
MTDQMPALPDDTDPHHSTRAWVDAIARHGRKPGVAIQTDPALPHHQYVLLAEFTAATGVNVAALARSENHDGRAA